MRNGEIQINLDNQKNPLYDNAEKIETVLRNAVRQANSAHKRANNPIAVSQNGEIIWLQPEEIKASV